MCLKVRLDVFCDQAYILIIYTCIRAYVCACEVHLVTACGHNLSFTSLAAAPCPSLVCSSNIVARCVSLVDRNCSHLSAMRFLLLQRTFSPPLPTTTASHRLPSPPSPHFSPRPTTSFKPHPQLSSLGLRCVKEFSSQASPPSPLSEPDVSSSPPSYLWAG